MRFEYRHPDLPKAAYITWAESREEADRNNEIRLERHEARYLPKTGWVLQ